MRSIRALAFGVALLLGAGAAIAAEEGVHCSLITDEDEDDAILMESEWISMHLLPWRQALVNRFVFRPSGNDIVEPLNPKIRMAGPGGGLMMDCFWEQDWRYQELAYKNYKYTITKNGPDEAQVVFDTNVVGYLNYAGSGVISKLLSNMTLKRTVTLKSGEPFFRFDVEFIDNDKWAKRPSYWFHNVSLVATDLTDTVIRPSERGLDAMGGNVDRFPAPHVSDFITDFNKGWTARISEKRKEGIVYLMDYDATETLYNQSNNTEEWWYDGILVFNKQPWKGRVYVLPIIGLSQVENANEYFICQVDAKNQDGKLALDYYVTSSYEKCARVTFNTEVQSNLIPREPRKRMLQPVVVEGLSIQPTRGRVEEPNFTDVDPLLLNISAIVELSDGTSKKFEFQKFHAGNYKLKRNSRDDGTLVVKLDRKVHNPKLPEVPVGLTINRKDFNVFGILGLGSTRLGVPDAVRSIPGAKLEIGYCAGSAPMMCGLGDFPYDYERLYDCRVMLFGNMMDKEIKRIGASVMLPWLKAGGGLVITGGENAFRYELEQHEINQYYPIQPNGKLKKGPLRLKAPEAPNHPIFKGIDLSNLPYVYYYHEIAMKPDTDAKVLMKVGDFPFIVEKKTGEQITMVVAANHFGNQKYFPDKPGLMNWSEWPKLYANIVRYAGHALP